MTIHRLVREVLRELEPVSARIEEARRRASALVRDLDRISDHFRVLSAYEFGSVACQTALRSFRDIDYLLELQPGDLLTRRGTQRAPGHTIGLLHDWFADHARAGLVSLGHIELRKQSHSLGVLYPRTNLRVDLVPAIKIRGQGCFSIPSRSRQAWVRTRPFAIAEALDALPPKVKDAIRLVKGWRRARGGRRKGLYLPSYAIAVLFSQRPIPAATTPPLELVEGLFSEISAADKRTSLVLHGRGQDAVVVRDPWSGESLLAGEDRIPRSSLHQAKKRLIELCRKACDDLAEAHEAIDRGRSARAHRLLIDLFIGERYRNR